MDESPKFTSVSTIDIRSRKIYRTHWLRKLEKIESAKENRNAETNEAIPTNSIDPFIQMNLKPTRWRTSNYLLRCREFKIELPFCPSPIFVPASIGINNHSISRKKNVVSTNRHFQWLSPLLQYIGQRNENVISRPLKFWVQKVKLYFQTVLGNSIMFATHWKNIKQYLSYEKK